MSGQDQLCQSHLSRNVRRIFPSCQMLEQNSATQPKRGIWYHIDMWSETKRAFQQQREEFLFLLLLRNRNLMVYHYFYAQLILGPPLMRLHQNWFHTDGRVVIAHKFICSSFRPSVTLSQINLILIFHFMSQDFVYSGSSVGFKK